MYNPIVKEKPGSIDWPLIMATLVLLAISAAFIYSARYSLESSPDYPWFKQYYVKQIIFFGMGLSAAIVLCFLDYHTWARYAVVFYWGSILLLVLV